MSFFDIVLDFILMDAFEDLENPPSSVLAVLRNRWLSDSFKETVGPVPPVPFLGPWALVLLCPCPLRCGMSDPGLSAGTRALPAAPAPAVCTSPSVLSSHGQSPHSGQALSHSFYCTPLS